MGGPRDELDLDVLEQAGSVFALANGHIGLRGNLDESEPQGPPGTYLNGFYEEYPVPCAKGDYGSPELGQAAVNVTNGKIIRLLVDDDPFDVCYGELRSHELVLDFRAGVLRRRADWVSPAAGPVNGAARRLAPRQSAEIAPGPGGRDDDEVGCGSHLLVATVAPRRAGWVSPPPPPRTGPAAGDGGA